MLDANGCTAGLSREEQTGATPLSPHRGGQSAPGREVGKVVQQIVDGDGPIRDAVAAAVVEVGDGVPGVEPVEIEEEVIDRHRVIDGEGRTG